MCFLDVGPKWRKNKKFHCHLLQQHARLETRGPSTTLLGTTWPPSGLSAHLSFIIINAKRGSGPLWRDCYWEIQLRAGPLRVHSGPLGSTCLSLLWGRQVRFESTRVHLGPLCGEPYQEIKLKSFRADLWLAPAVWAQVVLALPFTVGNHGEKTATRRMCAINSKHCT